MTDTKSEGKNGIGTMAAAAEALAEGDSSGLFREMLGGFAKGMAAMLDELMASDPRTAALDKIAALSDKQEALVREQMAWRHLSDQARRIGQIASMVQRMASDRQYGLQSQLTQLQNDEMQALQKGLMAAGEMVHQAIQSNEASPIDGITMLFNSAIANDAFAVAEQTKREMLEVAAKNAKERLVGTLEAKAEQMREATAKAAMGDQGAQDEADELMLEIAKMGSMPKCEDCKDKPICLEMARAIGPVEGAEAKAAEERLAAGDPGERGDVDDPLA